MRYIFLILFLCSSAFAGTEYTLNDSSETSALGLVRYTNKAWASPTNSFTVAFDNAANATGVQIWHTGDFGATWDAIRAAHPQDVDGSFNLFGYSDTLLLPMAISGSQFVFHKYRTTADTIVLVDADTLDVPSGANPTRLAGILRSGGTYLTVQDVNGATTDSTRFSYSNGNLAGASWTRVWDSLQVANAGPIIPIYDGSGYSRYFLKVNMNTEGMLSIDSLNKIKLVADSITQPSAGAAATDLQTPGYGAFDIIYLGGDCYAMAFQKGMTANKGLFFRSFKVTWTSTAITGWTWISNVVQVGSDAPADQWRYYPALQWVSGRRDSGFVWAMEVNGADRELVRYMTTDTGKTWSTQIQEQSTAGRFYANIQAPDWIVSAAGTISTGCFYEDSSTAATSSIVYAYLDTLYNPVVVSDDAQTKYINSATMRQRVNSILGPPYVNKE